jgi:hypothetical protein
MHTVTLTLPDPSALTWNERNDLRTTAANDERATGHHDEDVGVDIVPNDGR